MFSKTKQPTLNRERLVALAEWAGAQDARRRLGLPSEWDQRDWLTRNPELGRCGTACCLAGKVALEDGGVPYLDDLGWGGAEDGEVTSLVTFPRGSDPAAHVSVETYAQEVLGLDSDQAYRLFYGDNDLDTVLDVIGDLLGVTNP